ALEPWRSMREVLEEAARKHPERVAVEEEKTSLTFAELDARANQLSHHLMALEITAEQVVAVCFDRSPAALIALFGVLGAGGAVLPLDPGHPKERLSYMIQASGAQLLLTHRPLLSMLPSVNCPVLCLDDDEVASAISARPKTPTGAIVEREQLAYVI